MSMLRFAAGSGNNFDAITRLTDFLLDEVSSFFS
jgi:hypothetical protein